MLDFHFVEICKKHKNIHEKEFKDAVLQILKCFARKIGRLAASVTEPYKGQGGPLFFAGPQGFYDGLPLTSPKFNFKIFTKIEVVSGAAGACQQCRLGRNMMAICFQNSNIFYCSVYFFNFFFVVVVDFFFFHNISIINICYL